MQDLLSFILSNKDWFYKMGGGQEINRFMPSVHVPLFLLLPTIPLLTGTEWRGETKQLHHCFSTRGSRNLLYMDANQQNKISPTSTGQTKESPHPRGPARFLLTISAAVSTGANGYYHLLWRVHLLHTSLWKKAGFF
jgi:hypothetical protein